MGNEPTYPNKRSSRRRGLDVRTELSLLLGSCLPLVLGSFWFLGTYCARPIECGGIDVFATATDGQGGETALSKALDTVGFDGIRNMHDASIQANIGNLPDPSYITACLETGGKRIAIINGVQIKASPF